MFVTSTDRQRFVIADGVEQLRHGVASELLDFSYKKKTKTCTFADMYTPKSSIQVSDQIDR